MAAELKFLQKVETPEQAAKLASEIGTYLGSTDAVKVFDTKVFLAKEAVTPAQWKSIEKIRDANKGTNVLDGGVVSVAGKTWRTVAITVGAVIIAVVLLDPDSGDALTKNVANMATNLIEPFIPLVISSLFPIICLVSSLSLVTGLGQTAMSSF